MKKISGLFVMIACVILLVACEKDDSGDPGDEPNFTGETVAGYEVATQTALRSIPVEYINAARNNLHVAYQHTSHGTHVSYGMFGLQDFKDGDDVLFGITNNNPQAGKLDFRDKAIEGYAEPGVSAIDLSQVDETAFVQATRNYLDDDDNAEINVVMWSWCSIVDHHVTENYLPGMQQLIDEYGEGGSKVGSGAGQRENPVTFVFMTGHAEVNNIGNLRPCNQADAIIDYCNEYGYLCLDYYGIDSHDMTGDYWSDVDDNGNSTAYGGNFYQDWQDSHDESEDYYFNKNAPGGDVVCGDHNDQHITANRKAFAMWYILARIAGWDGITTNQ